MSFRRLAIVLGAALGLLVALRPAAGVAADQPSADRQSADRPSGIEMQYIDPSVRPQDNLYRYLNGKWLDGVQVPNDRPSYGTFNRLYDEAQDQLRAIIDSAAA